MKKKRQREKLGNVYAIPLPNGKFGFGRSLLDASIAIYQHIGNLIDDLPQSEEYQFIVGVYKDVLTCGEWPIVENRPFASEEEAEPPPTYIWDEFSGKYEQYYKGQITPSTKVACKGLESASVWESDLIVDRIMGGDTWIRTSREYWVIKEKGQEYFDELTKNT